MSVQKRFNYSAVGALLVGLLLPIGASAQSAQWEAIDPTDPFASVASGDEWLELNRTEPEVIEDDPFNNLAAGFWFNTWGGQWDDAVEEGMSSAEFFDTIQGEGGNGAILESPYPYESASEHYEALREAADGGTDHTQASLPDWSGDWSGGEEQFWNGGAALRDVWAATSDAYKPRLERGLQAEVEGRHWWPADTCLPNGFTRSGWEFRYFHTNPDQVAFLADQPVTLYRTAFTDGRGFDPNGYHGDQWYGESRAFWDGDELVVHTANIKANYGGHGLPEHSNQLELIERWGIVGDQMVADIIMYDPEAFAHPIHEIAVYDQREDVWSPPVTYNECVSTNNAYHDETAILLSVRRRTPSTTISLIRVLGPPCLTGLSRPSKTVTCRIRKVHSSATTACAKGVSLVD